MANGFEIVSATLFITDMGVNTSVSSCASQILALSEGDMLSIRVLIALSKSKVDDVHVVFGTFVSTDEEVIRLDVSVDYSLFMYFLNALNL